ncbi:MAG: isoaspartyl peptidase/L-asparaginase [Deltaproteobacteria bacterium]|nr:isoaspartyl peptidase/L-asparaginase [Deltaproteobacteria bacterium]MCB9786290.1 isoaspartyl peptidase/L-asparaginase [Deltaproteobacteria bacterium]
MSAPTVFSSRVERPAVLVHGGAGTYLAATTAEQRRERGAAMAEAARLGLGALRTDGGAAGVLAAVARLEADPRFNAGRGGRLQQDGRCRLSAALMDGARLRLSAVYNVQDCLHPSALAAALQERVDRNLDGEGARALMTTLGVPLAEVRTSANIERWRALVADTSVADPDSAVGDAGEEGLRAVREAAADGTGTSGALPPEDRRHGTVGAVSLGADGVLHACTSTGGRGHESPGRVSDSPTPAGNYACSRVAVSATGVGEQILELNVAARIATRMLDGMTLRDALTRTFVEVADHGGVLGVIALSADGELGYAHTTEACGVAWLDATGAAGLDPHSRG